MNQEKCLLRDSRLVSNWAAWCISEGPQWNHTDELSRGIRDCHSTDKFEQCWKEAKFRALAEEFQADARHGSLWLAWKERARTDDRDGEIQQWTPRKCCTQENLLSESTIIRSKWIFLFNCLIVSTWKKSCNHPSTRMLMQCHVGALKLSSFFGIGLHIPDRSQSWVCGGEVRSVTDQPSFHGFRAWLKQYEPVPKGRSRRIRGWLHTCKSQESGVRSRGDRVDKERDRER